MSASPLLRLILVPLQFTGTAIAFALFGVGGILYGLLVTPWLKLTTRTPEESRKRARAVVRFFFRVFVGFIRVLRLARIEVINPEGLMRPGSIIAASHPSLIDVVCLISIVPEATTIVKAKLLSNPFTRFPILASGYATNADGPEALEALSRELDSGASFVIFPEGTRTPRDLPPGKLPKMHRGAAQLALHTGRPITPVRVTAEPRWLTKDRGWWHLPEKPMVLTFEVLPEIPVADYLPLYNSSPRSAARRLTEDLGARLFEHNVEAHV